MVWRLRMVGSAFAVVIALMLLASFISSFVVSADAQWVSMAIFIVLWVGVTALALFRADLQALWSARKGG